MVPELEGEKDPKRARMVLSKGREVIRLGCSRLSGDAARATNREESGNLNRVDRVHREYDTDWVTRESWSNWDGYLGRRADWVTRDSRGN
jgi:hypothetical protein